MAGYCLERIVVRLGRIIGDPALDAQAGLRAAEEEGGHERAIKAQHGWSSNYGDVRNRNEKILRVDTKELWNAIVPGERR